MFGASLNQLGRYGKGLRCERKSCHGNRGLGSGDTAAILGPQSKAAADDTKLSTLAGEKGYRGKSPPEMDCPPSPVLERNHRRRHSPYLSYRWRPFDSPSERQRHSAR